VFSLPLLAILETIELFIKCTPNWGTGTTFAKTGGVIKSQNEKQYTEKKKKEKKKRGRNWFSHLNWVEVGFFELFFFFFFWLHFIRFFFLKL
jgi:hypothetical protein